MADEREVHVHLVPHLAPAGRLAGSVAVVIDVLRATTTIVQALASGCISVRPCVEVDEARQLAGSFPVGKVLLGGERGGVKLADFDLGNSPGEYSSRVCSGMTLVITTSNGTRAIARAAEAERVLIGAFVNYSAVCEQSCGDARPVHIVCAGQDGEPALEDTLLAGAFVDCLSEEQDIRPNDSARMAWDCFENHGRILLGALEVSRGGEGLIKLGYGEDLTAAAAVDKFAIVPELRKGPLRIEVGGVGIVKRRWVK